MQVECCFNSTVYFHIFYINSKNYTITNINKKQSILSHISVKTETKCQIIICSCEFLCIFHAPCD